MSRVFEPLQYQIARIGGGHVYARIQVNGMSFQDPDGRAVFIPEDCANDLAAALKLLAPGYIEPGDRAETIPLLQRELGRVRR